MTTTRVIEISSSDDTIDVRDIIARVEELEEEREPLQEAFTDAEEGLSKAIEAGEKDIEDLTEERDDAKAALADWDEADEGELKRLTELLSDLCGNGGDEQYKGDWYPITLISDDHFEDYAREMVEDCGYIAKDFPSWIKVDWAATASNVQQDYSQIEYEGVTYWYR